MRRLLNPYIKALIQAIVRRQKPVIFGDLLRVAPVSKIYGGDRGTVVDRYYIHSYLASKRILISGKALEVAETRYLTQFGGSKVEKNILAPREGIAKSNDGADGILIADLTQSGSVPEAMFDCFVCTQTLNFIYDLKSAIFGAHRLLKPGGIFLGTVSGIAQISRYDMDRWGDYWRFTPLSIKRLLVEEFGSDVEVESFGNALAAQLCLQGIAIEDLPDSSLLDVRDEDYPVLIGFCARKA